MTPNEITNLIGPAAQQTVWAAIIMTPIIGFAIWYLFFKDRRVWIAQIWEVSSHGRYDLVSIDKVTERKVKGKNAHIYWLKKKKYAVPPVTDDYCVRYKGKSRVDYLRSGSDYIPLRRDFYQRENEWQTNFTPMPYDVSMQMISTEKLLEEMFKQKKDFLEKYGWMIGLSLIVVLMIVLMSLHYDFVKQSLQPVIESNNILKNLGERFIRG